MKKTNQKPNLHIYRATEPRYPNAAEDRYFAAKALNLLTAIVSGMGFTSAMLFLVTLA